MEPQGTFHFHPPLQGEVTLLLGFHVLNGNVASRAGPVEPLPLLQEGGAAQGGRALDGRAHGPAVVAVVVAVGVVDSTLWNTHGGGGILAGQARWKKD